MGQSSIADRSPFIQACFGGTLFGMDTGIIGGVLTLPDFKRYSRLVYTIK